MSEEKRVDTTQLLATATRPVFPFFILKIEERKEAGAPASIAVEVDKAIREYLVKAYGSNEIVCYLDPTNAQIQAWTPSMHLSFELMNEFGLMSDVKTWLINARPFLESIMKLVRFPGEQV